VVEDLGGIEIHQEHEVKVELIKISKVSKLCMFERPDKVKRVKAESNLMCIFLDF
jgi:hypothetical protein